MWASSPQPTGGEPSSETSSPQPTKQHTDAAPYSLSVAYSETKLRRSFFFLVQTVCDFHVEANHSLHLGVSSARKLLVRETVSGISHETMHPVSDQRQSKANVFLNPTWSYWALQYLLLFES